MRLAMSIKPMFAAKTSPGVGTALLPRKTTARRARAVSVPTKVVNGLDCRSRSLN
jgi:hypothetical protein